MGLCVSRGRASGRVLCCGGQGPHPCLPACCLLESGEQAQASEPEMSAWAFYKMAGLTTQALGVWARGTG